MRPLGPYSRSALANLDGRTKEARLLRDFRADLAAHVGGKPSATQAALIQQAAMLQLHIALMDRKAAEGAGGLSVRDGREYLAWANALSRLLRQLGTKGTAAAPPSLADHLAGRRTAA